ncbi:hypothetical protein LCGC14_0319240 [marine sediment metagenome]|uniref:Uncharacterized protein n=1 Tax=marine sediment metagenome TaxID=412755 RepID=A0A0F9W714_9ZZZZ
MNHLIMVIATTINYTIKFYLTRRVLKIIGRFYSDMEYFKDWLMKQHFNIRCVDINCLAGI